MNILVGLTILAAMAATVVAMKQKQMKKVRVKARKDQHGRSQR